MEESERRTFLKKAVIGGAGAAGAAYVAGLASAPLILGSPSSSSSANLSQWAEVTSASCIVLVDSNGSYYVKDTGIGNQVGAMIVNASVITAYGASLRAGTAGATTTTGGIQEAINAVGTAGGGIVHVKAGTYTVSSPISDGSYSNIVLEGEGESTVIGCTSGFANDIVSINAAGWIVRSLKVDGSNQTKSELYAGIRIGSTSSRCEIADCLVTSCDHSNMDVDGRENRVVNNYSLNSYSDDIICRGTRCFIVNNVCDTTTNHNNISLVGATDCTVSGNVCSNAGDGAKASTYGIALENIGGGACVRCSVIGNVIVSPSSDGIEIYPQNGGVDSAVDCVISDNVIDTPGGGGIMVNGGSHLQINGNQVHYPGSHGISLGASTIKYVQINSNLIDIRAAGFNAINPSTIGISNIQIVGNICIISGPCRGVNGTGVSYFVIRDNLVVQVASSNMNGIIMSDTSIKGQISGNNVYGNGSTGSGIYLHTSISDVTVEGNYVEGFGTGINEDSSSDYNQICENNVRNSNTTKIATVGAHTIIKNNQGYNPVSTSSATAGSSPYTFPALPYDAVYVITAVGGMAALTLDAQALFDGSFSVRATDLRRGGTRLDGHMDDHSTDIRDSPDMIIRERLTAPYEYIRRLFVWIALLVTNPNSLQDVANVLFSFESDA